MAQATKRIQRKPLTRKNLKLPLSTAAREFHERWRKSSDTRYEHSRALPEDAPHKAKREAYAKDAGAGAEYDAYVAHYLTRFYKADEFLRPRSINTVAEIVDLAVAGIDNARAARTLCVAIARGAGLKIF